MARARGPATLRTAPKKHGDERRIARAFRAFYDSRPGWADGNARYLRLVNTLVRPEMTVLDVAAGGGGEGFAHGLRGRVRRVVGTDIDPAVEKNPNLDEGVVADVTRMPFAAGTFDLAVCNYAFEHFEDAAGSAAEIARVLKPGAALVFRTPNRWHYISIAARALPQRLHRAVADWARSSPAGATDSVPTHYRLNTARALIHHLGRAGLVPERLELVEPQPSYLTFSPWAFLLGVLYERVVSFTPFLAPLRANILGVFVKRGPGMSVGAGPAPKTEKEKS